LNVQRLGVTIFKRDVRVTTRSVENGVAGTLKPFLYHLKQVIGILTVRSSNNYERERGTGSQIVHAVLVSGPDTLPRNRKKYLVRNDIGSRWASFRRHGQSSFSKRRSRFKFLIILLSYYCRPVQPQTAIAIMDIG